MFNSPSPPEPQPPPGSASPQVLFRQQPLLGEGWFLPSHPTWTAQLLHGGFACLPSSCSSFPLPLSLPLHFATISIEKDSWKQIGQVSLLVCLESWKGRTVVPFLGSVSPRKFYISLSEGLYGLLFYIGGNRLKYGQDVLIALSCR